MADFDPITAVLKLAVLAFSIVMHEVAHGYVAYRLGDPTAKSANRLTLNPVAHIDLMGSIVVPLMLVLSNSGFLFGWAKPVPVNPSYFRNPKRDNILVSLAGVSTNMVLAIVFGVLFRILSPGGALGFFLLWGCIINVVLAVFNMLPVPPLDGSHVVAALLSPRAAESYRSISRFGIVIIMILAFTGILGRIISPVINLLLALLLGLQ